MLNRLDNSINNMAATANITSLGMCFSCFPAGYRKSAFAAPFLFKKMNNPLFGLYYQTPRKPHKFNYWIWLLLALFLFLLLIKHAKAETASWYSYESCRKEGTNGIYTASGKRFNENDYTAAMWGVPFGTLVKVTNIANGLSVTVRINDRGPAKRLVKKGRIIDLSKGAFRQIADLKQGIISVKIEIIKLVKGETIYATQE